MRNYLRFVDQCSPSFSMEFLVGSALAIALVLWPATWEGKLILLLLLVAVMAVIVWRSPLPRRPKFGALLLSLVLVAVLGARSVLDQYHADAILDAYQAKRDLAAKYQAHEESLRRIVAQYDSLKRAQSLFDSMTLREDGAQRAAINDRTVMDVTSALDNIDSIASPLGAALKVRLGQNLFRVVFPVPMRIAPELLFTGVPGGAQPTLIENSNLGFTVLFLPLSIPVEYFGFSASAEIQP